MKSNRRVKLCLGILVTLLTSRLLAQDQPATQPARTVELPGKINLEMIWIAPGKVVLGRAGAIGRGVNMPETDVTISKGFWLGKYELTQAQWSALMHTTPRDMFAIEVAAGADVLAISPGLGVYHSHGEGPNFPMYDVPWAWAMQFCRKLTDQERTAGRLPDGYEFTLPTEAESVYACRAGTTTTYYNGDADAGLNQIAWVNSARGSGSMNMMHPVGQKIPNSWGLYDMLGNVGEWCYDEFPPRGTKATYPGVAVTDFTGYDTAGAGWHVVRGGSVATVAQNLKNTGYRNGLPDSISGMVDSAPFTGFRVALASAPRAARTPMPVRTPPNAAPASAPVGN